jgi:hypothetical protein
MAEKIKYLCNSCHGHFEKEDMKFADDQFADDYCVYCHNSDELSWTTFNTDLYYEIKKIKNGDESTTQDNDYKTIRQKLRFYISKFRSWLLIRL